MEMEIEKDKTILLCPRCKSVPNIQLKPKINDLFIYYHCKCGKDLMNYQDFKDKFMISNPTGEINKTPNIPIFTKIDPKTKQPSNFEVDLDAFNQKYQKAIKDFDEYCLYIKNLMVNYLQKQIEEINQNYEKNKKINEKIQSIYSNLINSYTFDKENITNRLNILNNNMFTTDYRYKIKAAYTELNEKNLNISNQKDIIKFYQNKFLSHKHNYDLSNLKYFCSHPRYTTQFIEYNENIGISCSRDDQNTVVYDIPNLKELFAFKSNFGGYNGCMTLINEGKNLLTISEEYTLKIWPSFTDEFIKEKLELIEKGKNEEGNNNFKKNPPLIELNPIFTTKLGFNVFNIQSINKNYFICRNNKNILIYKIEYNSPNEIKGISLVKEITSENTKFTLMPKDTQTEGEKETYKLIISDKNNLSVYDIKIDINSLEAESVFNIPFKKAVWSRCLKAIDSKRVIFNDEDMKRLKVLNVDTLEIISNIMLDMEAKEVYPLNDETILVSDQSKLERYSLFSLNSLGTIYEIFDDDDFDREQDLILEVTQLSDSKLALCFKRGCIEIGYLKSG